MFITDEERDSMMRSGYTIKATWRDSRANNALRYCLFRDILMANAYLRGEYANDPQLYAYPDYRLKEDYNESYWQQVPIAL